MSAPPLRTELADTYPLPSNATMRVGQGKFWDFVTGLLGLTGDAPEARAALGVAPRATRIDVASVAGTVNLTTGAPNTDDIQLTGALAITAFTVAVGRVVRVRASGACTLTNNASIVTQTGGNIVCAAGDTFTLRATAANVVEVLGLSRVTGVKGTATNDNAQAGHVGEYVENTSGSIGLSSGVGLNLVSLSLTAGDWDVWGGSSFVGTGATISQLTTDVNAASATIGANATAYQMGGASFSSGATGVLGIAALPRRFSLAATTTVYLNASAFFGAGTLATNSNILCARRAR